MSDMPPIDRERMTELLYALASGISVEAALAQCKVTFSEYCGWRWGSQSFERAVCSARKVSADHFIDELLKDLETVPVDTLNGLKLKLDNLKWLAERLNPDAFGARPKTEIKNLNYAGGGNSELPQPRVVILDKDTNGKAS